jgi:hypothetical protein
MLANPGRPLADATRDPNSPLHGRGANTVYMIAMTDMFREYLEKRRKEYQSGQDQVLRQKMTKVATLGLDLILEKFETKRDAVPLQVLTTTVGSTLDRLGYAPKQAPTVQVNTNVDNRTQTLVAPVSLSELEEARKALRLVEQKRADTPMLAHQPFIELSQEEAVEESSRDLDLAAE